MTEQSRNRLEPSNSWLPGTELSTWPQHKSLQLPKIPGSLFCFLGNLGYPPCQAQHLWSPSSTVSFHCPTLGYHHFLETNSSSFGSQIHIQSWGLLAELCTYLSGCYKHSVSWSVSHIIIYIYVKYIKLYILRFVHFTAC